MDESVETHKDKCFIVENKIMASCLMDSVFLCTASPTLYMGRTSVFMVCYQDSQLAEVLVFRKLWFVSSRLATNETWHHLFYRNYYTCFQTLFICCNHSIGRILPSKPGLTPLFTILCVCVSVGGLCVCVSVRGCVYVLEGVCVCAVFPLC